MSSIHLILIANDQGLLIILRRGHLSELNIVAIATSSANYFIKRLLSVKTPCCLRNKYITSWTIFFPYLQQFYNLDDNNLLFLWIYVSVQCNSFQKSNSTDYVK